MSRKVSKSSQLYIDRKVPKPISTDTANLYLLHLKMYNKWKKKSLISVLLHLVRYCSHVSPGKNLYLLLASFKDFQFPYNSYYSKEFKQNMALNNFRIFCNLQYQVLSM